MERRKRRLWMCRFLLCVLLCISICTGYCYGGEKQQDEVSQGKMTMGLYLTIPERAIDIQVPEIPGMVAPTEPAFPQWPEELDKPEQTEKPEQDNVEKKTEGSEINGRNSFCKADKVVGAMPQTGDNVDWWRWILVCALTGSMICLLGRMEGRERGKDEENG